jgi:hypothetical protein
MNWKYLALIVILSGSLSGCLFRKKPVMPPPPPPPLPAPIQPAPPDPMPPPGVEPPAPDLTEEAPPGMPEEELPPAPKPEPQPRRRNSRPAPAAAPVNTPKPAPGEEPAAPAPQLGEVITPEQRAELRRTFDEANSQARQSLSKLEGRTLTGEQAESAARVRAFLSQAESLLEGDPRSAAELARRAALLARDLAGGMR